MNDLELWADIPGFANYEVSTWGQVRRKGRRVLKASVARGYLKVQLSMSGVASQRLIHRLVALTFLPNPDNLPEVDHKDRVKTNNRLSNLRWVSRRENELNKGRQSNNQSGYKHIGTCRNSSREYWYIHISSHDINRLFNKEAWTLEQVYDLRNNLYEEHGIQRFD